MEYMDFKKKDDREVLQLERFPLEKGELPVLHYPLLDACGMVKHCFTTRGGGASKGMFESLNLSFTRGDDEADVQENYARVASFFGTDKTQFVCSDQTHTTNVRRVGKEDAGYGVTRPRPYKDVDGLVTDEPGIILSTFYADCVATVYKGNIIKNLIMDCQSYTKYRPNETTGGIFVSWRRKEELPTGA